MSFDYLMVVPGVIGALTLGSLLGGVARLLQYRHVRWCPEHIGWVMILFVVQIRFWHVSSRREGVELTSDLLGYFAFLVFPVLLYLASAILMPKDMQGQSFSLRDHYYNHSRAFFFICGVASLSVIVLGKVFEARPLCSMANASRLFGGILCFALAFSGRGWEISSRQRLHRVVTGLAMISLFFFLYLASREGKDPREGHARRCTVQCQQVLYCSFSLTGTG